MDAAYNAFFNILNQLILIGLTLAGPDGKLGWFNAPFGLLFVGLNLKAVLIWRHSSLSVAWQFYSTANRVCFLVMAVLGIIAAGAFEAARSLGRT